MATSIAVYLNKEDEFPTQAQEKILLSKWGLDEAHYRLDRGVSPIVGQVDKEGVMYICESFETALSINRDTLMPIVSLAQAYAKEDDSSQAGPSLEELCDEVKVMLLEKNRKYGDSAMNPVRIFSKSSAEEQTNVRLDDKLSRVANRQDDEDEDVILDLIGYLYFKLKQSRTPK